MTVNEELIKRVAQSLDIDEAIVSKIVTYQAKSAKAAANSGSIIEFSGLGTFRVRMNVVEKLKLKYKRIFDAAKKELEEVDKDDPDWYRRYKRFKSAEREVAYLDNKHKNQTKFKNDRVQEDTAGDS